MKITWFGHSCFRIEIGSSVALIDPFLTGNPTFEGSGVAADSATAGVTHVLLTHGHDDHVGDTVAICQSTGAKLVAVFELSMYLNGKGVENVDPTNHGGTVDQGDFKVTFVNAQHSSSTMVDGQPVYLGNPCGLIVAPKDGPTLYHMGDTEVMSDFAIINDLHAPSVGIVPIGDRFTMGAKSAAFACRRFFRFETIIPCHYGTFPIIDQTADAFVSEMSGHNVVVPAVGDAIQV